MATASILRLEADGDYVHVHAGTRSHQVTATGTWSRARAERACCARYH